MVDDTARSADSALERLFYRTDRVPFVYWREFTGAKTTVAIVAAVAVLTFLTGLSTMSQPDVAFDGPIAGVVPEPVLLQFTAVLLAFVVGGLVVGLGRRKRLAWHLTLLAVPLTALLPLATFRPIDVPLLALVAIAVPLLIANRSAFDQRIELTSLQVAALSSFVGVLVYGTTGSYAMREQFLELETWGDAIYYVIVTIATVGYGDITPTTVEAKWFSLSIILFGTGAFTAIVGTFVAPAIEKRMATALGNMTPSELTLLEDHVLVLGYSDLSELVLEELGDVDVVVVTANEDAAADLDDRDVNVLTDDPAIEETLEAARIGDARGVVVATYDDARDALAVLAARNANPDVRIVAAASDRRHADKLLAVGADDVVSPVEIGGRLLGQSVLDEANGDGPMTDDDAPAREPT